MLDAADEAQTGPAKDDAPRDFVVVNMPERSSINKNGSFYVYCKTCKQLQVGKLRAYCSSCDQTAITFDGKEPSKWRDVLRRFVYSLYKKSFYA